MRERWVGQSSSNAWLCLTDDTGAEIPVLEDDLDELVVVLLSGAVGVDVDGERLSDTNGVRELDEGAASEASLHEGLGDPTGGICGRPVDLGEVLAGEGTTTVGTPATVGVDDDLAASDTGVTLGTTNDEETRRLKLRQALSVLDF